MPLVVDTNSYVDVAWSNLYFRDRATITIWEDVDNKDTILVSATQFLDSLCDWYEDKLYPDQALMFPRTGQTVVPNDIMVATCEIAIEMGKVGVYSFVDTNNDLLSLKAGSVKLEFSGDENTEASLVNSISRRILSAYGICNFNSKNGVISAPLIR